MKWRDWLEKYKPISLKLNLKLLDMEWKLDDPDRDAAWDMYIELLTRIATQALPDEQGVEKSALDSVYHLFPLTREIIKKHGRSCAEFTKIAVVVLNQVIRPFTANWHRLMLQGALDDSVRCQEFRRELAALQGKLLIYARMLSDMAGVEDLTELEGE